MQFSQKIIVLFIAAGALMPGLQNAWAAGMGCSPLNKPTRYTDNRFDPNRSVAHRAFRQAPRPAYRPPVPMGTMPARHRYERYAMPGHRDPIRHDPRAMRHTPPHRLHHSPRGRWETHAYRGYGNHQWHPAQNFSPPGSLPWGMPRPRWGAGPVHVGGVDPRRHAARYPYPPMARYLAQPHRIQPPYYPGMPGPGTRNHPYGQGNQNTPARWQHHVYKPMPSRAYGYSQPGWYGRPPVYAYRGPVWQPPGTAWRPTAGRPPRARGVSWGPYYAMPRSGPGMRAGGAFSPMWTMPRTRSEQHTPQAARIGADTGRAPAPATPVPNETAEIRTEPPTLPHGVDPAVPVSPPEREADLKSSKTPAAPVAEDDADRLPGMVEPIDSPSPRGPGGTGRTAGTAVLDGAREESRPQTTDHALSTNGFLGAYPASPGKRQTAAMESEGKSWIFRDRQEGLIPEDPIDSAEASGAPSNGGIPAELSAPPIPALAAGDSNPPTPGALVRR